MPGWRPEGALPRFAGSDRYTRSQFHFERLLRRDARRRRRVRCARLTAGRARADRGHSQSVAGTDPAGGVGEQMEPFEEAYRTVDWSGFAKLPLFDAANRINAYNTYLLMEREAMRK
jgi:hypothetical protein